MKYPSYVWVIYKHNCLMEIIMINNDNHAIKLIFKPLFKPVIRNNGIIFSPQKLTTYVSVKLKSLDYFISFAFSFTLKTTTFLS